MRGEDRHGERGGHGCARRCLGRPGLQRYPGPSRLSGEVGLREALPGSGRAGRRVPPRNERRRFMATGTVKWCNDAKGFGFITLDGGGEDVFVHHTAINMDGFRTLAEWQRVEFEV